MRKKFPNCLQVLHSNQGRDLGGTGGIVPLKYLGGGTVVCNVMLYNVDDFIRTQIDTQIGYVQSDMHEFSIRRSDRYCRKFYDCKSAALCRRR